MSPAGVGCVVVVLAVEGEGDGVVGVEGLKLVVGEEGRV